jgi:hypothetical protein
MASNIKYSNSFNPEMSPIDCILHQFDNCGMHIIVSIGNGQTLWKNGGDQGNVKSGIKYVKNYIYVV